MSACLSVCLSVCLSACLRVCLHACLPSCPSTYLPSCPSAYLPVLASHVSICNVCPINLFARHFMLVYQSACVSVLASVVSVCSALVGRFACLGTIILSVCRLVKVCVHIVTKAISVLRSSNNLPLPGHDNLINLPSIMVTRRVCVSNLCRSSPPCFHL